MMADTTVDSVRRTDTQIDSKKQRTRNEEDWLQNKRKRWLLLILIPGLMILQLYYNIILHYSPWLSVLDLD